MDSDGFMNVNMQRVFDAIDMAEVLVVGFTLFPQRLLVDYRFSAEEPPLIKVVEPVQSAEDRIRELKKLRPQFAAPARFHFFVWPRRVGTLASLGVWPRVVQRCLDSGHARVAGDCNLVLDQLYQLERAEIQAAIKGPQYRTIWERSR